MKKYLSILLFLFSLLIYVTNLYASEESILSQGLDTPEGFVGLSYKTDLQLMSGAFIHGETRITMEVLRGEPTPELMLQNDPDAPPFAIDIRLMDEAGQPFFIQIGGDRPIDPSWEYTRNTRYDMSSEDKVFSAKNNFSAAKKMIKKIRKSRFKAKLDPEYQSILNTLPIIEGALANEDVEGYDSDESKGTGCTDTHRIEIWKKRTFLIAEHSSTLAKIISSGSTYQVWSACNHGTCPEGSNINLSCAKNFENRCAFDTGAPHCTSSYGFFPGQHVCNDDTYIQYQRIKNDSEPDEDGGTCSDSSLKMYAPDCW